MVGTWADASLRKRTFARAHTHTRTRTLNPPSGLPAAKMGCKASALMRALWGDFAMQPKTKRIVRIRPSELAKNGGKLRPLFVQLALQPLWTAYAACLPECADPHAVLTKIVGGLGLTAAAYGGERAIKQSDARQARWVVCAAMCVGGSAEAAVFGAPAVERGVQLAVPLALLLLSPHPHSYGVVDTKHVTC
jgi:hypothetical protein